VLSDYLCYDTRAMSTEVAYFERLLFDQQRLRSLLVEQGVRRMNFEYVPNHMIVVAQIEQM
jgi:hypothetical protein